MAAAEGNSTVILATACAQVDDVLSVYQGALDNKPTPAAAAAITATIEPLRRAVAVLSQAVAASVGYTTKTPGTKGARISATVAPLDDSALTEGGKQPRNDEGT